MSAALEVELFDGRDAAWIDRVLDVVETALGQPWRMLTERLDAAGLRVPARRVAAIVRALRASLGGRIERARIARMARGAALGMPALDGAARAARITAAAAELGIAPEDVDGVLWADIAMERPVLLPNGRPRAADLAAIANLDRIQQALRRAHRAELVVWDRAHELVRTAKRFGLLASVSRRGDATVLGVTGPLALFRATTIYGNALAALAPLLIDHERFDLDVTCDLRTGERHLHVAPPVLLPSETARRPGRRPAARLGGELEARGCTVEAEPPPLASGEQLLFPELAVEHRGTRAYVELVGFSTDEYLAHRLAQYRSAGIDAVVLCVDATRAEDDGARNEDPRVLRYTRTRARGAFVDPTAVLGAIERLGATSRPPSRSPGAGGRSPSRAPSSSRRDRGRPRCPP
ncbi:MAG: DUF790 family protein [Deltaproteobacteria bacterium]|nr:DUF790 family protein [Deltaproteobacteria bacterium]